MHGCVLTHLYVGHNIKTTVLEKLTANPVTNSLSENPHVIPNLMGDIFIHNATVYTV